MLFTCKINNTADSLGYNIGSAAHFPSSRPRDRISRNAPNGRVHRQ